MNLSPLPIQKFFANNGRPLDGGLLFTYIAGTTTKIDTYTDSTGASLNSNPIVLDFRGEASVWLNPSLTYKFVLAPRGDTDPPTNPIWTVDNITSGIGYAEIIALITQSFIASILYPQSSLEAACGISPTAAQMIYAYGTPIRAPTFYADFGQIDYGDVPTYIDATHFSVPGDRTSAYTPFARVTLIGASSRADLRVVSSVFGAVTTVTVSASETGDTAPNPILAVWIEKNPPSIGPSSLVTNVNAITGQFVINRANGTATASRTSWGTTDAAGALNSALNCVAVSPNYVGAYLANGFPSGGRAVIYTPPSFSMEIGTSDLARILIPSGNTPINFLNDIAVISTYGGATRAVASLHGTADVMFEMKVSAVQKGYLYASATEVVMGSSVAVDVSFLYNGARVLSFSGANATGAATPTLGANKPGANTAVSEWLTCKNGAGATRYIPMWS